MYASNRAFSLLELLITLIIIAILVGIALPSYNLSLMHSRRLDGKIGLYHLAAQIEKSSSQLSSQSPEGFYTLAVVQKSDNYFLIAAYPEKSQVNDKSCGILAMDSLGNKGILKGNQIISNKPCW